jgi:hypothetical protein
MNQSSGQRSSLMQPHASGGKITFFQWTTNRGLVETIETFQSLDDLFRRCLDSGARGYVEDVTIAGFDQSGVRRQVTLTFRSVTQPDPTTSAH